MMSVNASEDGAGFADLVLRPELLHALVHVAGVAANVG
jgi:hypothetical protein